MKNKVDIISTLQQIKDAKTFPFVKYPTIDQVGIENVKMAHVHAISSLGTVAIADPKCKISIFSKTGKLLNFFMYDRAIAINNTTSYITGMAFLPNGLLVVSAIISHQWDGIFSSIRLFQPSTGKMIKHYPIKTEYSTTDPDNLTVLSNNHIAITREFGCIAKIQLLDLLTGNIIKSISASDKIKKLKTLPNGLLISMDYICGDRPAFKIYNLTQEKIIRSFPQKDYLNHMVVLPNNDIAVAKLEQRFCFTETTIQFIHTKNGRKYYTLSYSSPLSEMVFHQRALELYEANIEQKYAKLACCSTF